MGSGTSTVSSDNFADLSNWSISSGTPSVSGNVLTLSNGDVVTSNQTFSGAFDLTYDLQLSGGSSELEVGLPNPAINDLLQGSDIHDTAVHHVRISFDGTGNADTFLNGSSTSLQHGSGSPTSGSIAFFSMGSNPAMISNLKVTAFGGASNVSTLATASSLGAVDLSTVTDAIQDVATLRANNGASQSRLGFAAEVLTTSKANIEAASSRITDVDVADESTQLARYNVLTQAGTAMLSQANQSTQIALKLLG